MRTTTERARAAASFTDVGGARGILVEDLVPSRPSTFMPEIMQGGAAWLDVDTDGDLDLYLVRGGPASGSAASDGTSDDTVAGVENLFFRQVNGRYEEATAASGLGDRGFGMGCAAGDIDLDGDVDLYVTNYGPDRLYRNDGKGSFQDITGSAMPDPGDGRWSSSACFVDIDADNDLDLFVLHYVRYLADIECTFAGKPEYCGPENYAGELDSLYENRGDGTFVDVSERSGIGKRAGRGLGVLVVDFDQDARLDLYVANDGEANFLWRNRGDGTFEEVGLSIGVSLNGAARPEASMGIDAIELREGGRESIFVTHWRAETNTLYTPLEGVALFEDGTLASGLSEPGRALTGFGTCFFDADHDGDADVAIVNGSVRRPAGVSGRDGMLDYAERNILFENEGSGKFRHWKEAAGAFGEHVEVSRALMAADDDGDGDLDLLVANLGAPPRLYRNDLEKTGNWLMVRVLAGPGRWDALGARLLLVGEGRRFVRWVRATRGYQTCWDPRVHVGLGTLERIDEFTVVWPGGKREVFAGSPVNRVVTLVRGEGKSR